MWKKGGNDGEGIDQPLALAALVLLIYTETGHMYSQARVQLYKVTTEALSRHSEALSSCPRVAPNVVLCFATAPLHRARTFLFGRGSTAPDDAGISGISRLELAVIPFMAPSAPSAPSAPGTFGTRHPRHQVPSVPAIFDVLPPVATCTRREL